MGLDISVCSNKHRELYKKKLFDFHKHGLSREFCYFMGRANVINHEPELEQISKITDVDISPIKEMDNYPDDSYINAMLEYKGYSEEEKNMIVSEAMQNREKLYKNIDRVTQTIELLIKRLSNINDLNSLLIETNYDTLNALYYFSDFNIDKGEENRRNNFGQDLRNFVRYLKLAKEHGATTVWFEYG